MLFTILNFLILEIHTSSDQLWCESTIILMDDCFGTCINSVHSLIMMAGYTVKYPIKLDFSNLPKLQPKSVKGQILDSEARGGHVPFIPSGTNAFSWWK